MKLFYLKLAFILITFSATAQNNSTEQNLKNTIYYLADDKLEGRNTGSAGETLASDYIISEYKKIGITPLGDDGNFLQTFNFPYGKELGLMKENFLVFGETSTVIGSLTDAIAYQNPLALGTDYFPLPNSGNGTVNGLAVSAGYGIVCKEKKYDDYDSVEVSGKIVFIAVSTPDGDNPHHDLYPYSDIQTKIKNAEEHGAVAVLFYNDNPKAEDLKYDLTKTTPTSNIPVAFVSNHGSFIKKIKSGSIPVRFAVALKKVERRGHNVIGYLDNGAKTTVVIGAHYDHLGLGHDGNSLYAGPETIHNGADDNASGTAAVIELARLLKKSNLNNNNYLFINFSGEELGLIGSNYWINHASIDTGTINYMVNMDMVGRYRSNKGLDVEGLGTSPSFSFIKTFSYDTLKFHYSDKGTGPTDHTSFYYANIPVLNFFTGSHEDYHKPSDDANLINYNGETTIVNYIFTIIDSLNKKAVFAFTKTEDKTGGDTPKFTVKLGIMPDYLFDGPGLRVDGVSEGLPAQKAGILKGDIIIKMGALDIADINTYMKGLSMFMKGDTTTIRVKRGDKEMDLPLSF